MPPPSPESIYTFDNITNSILSDGFFSSVNLASYLSTNPKKGPTFEIPQDMKNLSSYNSLSFDIKFVNNISDKVMIAFTDKDFNILNKSKISDYITYNTPLVWHRVKINIGSTLTNVSYIMFYYDEPRTVSTLNIDIDNIIAGNETYYCSHFLDNYRWVDNLDPAKSLYGYENETYKQACEAVKTFGWTGNKCCGDDYREFYNDSLGGCWKGYPVMNDKTVKNSTNNNSLSDLIWVNSSSSSGFYQCIFSKGASTTSTICEVNASCSSSETEVLQMSGDTNAHASKDGSYSMKLCCNSTKYSQIIQNNIYLSANTNAHISNTSDAGYTALSIGSSGGTKTCQVYSGGCPPGNSSLFSLSSSSNAHIAKPFFYTTNYCCDVEGTPVSLGQDYQGEPMKVTPVNACGIKGTHFCGINNSWSNDGIQIGDYNIPSYRRDTLKNVTLLKSLIPSLVNTISDSNCCPSDLCWNGTTCIDDTIIYNITPTPPGQTPKAVMCVNGVFEVKDEKFSPFHDYSGYCANNFQCYYNNGVSGSCHAPEAENGMPIEEFTCIESYCEGNNSIITLARNKDGRSNNEDYRDSTGINHGHTGTVCCNGSWWINVSESAWNSSCNGLGEGLEDGGWYKCNNMGTIVKEGEEYTDFYCSNGSWSSRTKLLADKLLGIANNSNPLLPFSIFCDNINESVTLNDNIMLLNGKAIDLQKYAVKLREGNDISKPTYSACVLSIDKNKNGLMGDIVGSSADDVIIGIPLNSSFTDNFFVSYEDCFGSTPLIEGNNYTSCIGDYSNKIYYNNAAKIIIFSQKAFTVNHLSRNIFLRIIDWFKSFLGLAPRMGKNVSDYPSLVYANRSNFTDMLNNHIYYYNDGAGKQISGTKEYKYSTTSADNKYKYLIYIKYSGFTNLNFCTKKDGTPPQYITPKSMDQGYGNIACNESNTTIIMELYPTSIGSKNDYWADLTGRTR